MEIYKIENTVTGKLYIGKSKNSSIRFKAHIKNAKKKVNRYLYDAMNKYGIEAFTVTVLEDVTPEIANEKETYWISVLDTLYPNGYNMTTGGDGGNTLTAWDDEKRKALFKQQGDKRRGKRSEYWRKAIAEANSRKPKKTSQELKLIAEKISNTNKKKGITFPKTIMYGKDNPNYTEVDVQECLSLLKAGWKLKELAVRYDTTSVTVGAKIKAATGKTFTEWKRENDLSEHSR